MMEKTILHPNLILDEDNNILFIDCIFCLSKMIFDNKDSFECSLCREKITNENY